MFESNTSNACCLLLVASKREDLHGRLQSWNWSCAAVELDWRATKKY
jgi:hypothetical protein